MVREFERYAAEPIRTTSSRQKKRAIWRLRSRVPGEEGEVISGAGRVEESRLEKRDEIRSIRVEADFSEREKKDFSEGGYHGGRRGFGARVIGDFIWKGEGGEADSGARSSGVGPIGNR
jgi:hypothetical protein